MVSRDIDNPISGVAPDNVNEALVPSTTIINNHASSPSDQNTSTAQDNENLSASISPPPPTQTLTSHHLFSTIIKAQLHIIKTHWKML